MKIIQKNNWKLLRSDVVNYNFNIKNGYMEMYGSSFEEDPLFSPYGPFILDLEITTKCNGVNGRLCSYCYKSNTKDGDNMPLEKFKKILDKVNSNGQLTQLAFGLGSTAEENPQLWDMCDYARKVGVIPNGTVADISDMTADKISQLFGACAVSNHEKEACYDSVKKLTDRGLIQTNIHQVIYRENLHKVYELIDDIKIDKRLEKLNAVVFLSLKKTGRALKNKMTALSQEEFSNLIKYAMSKNINFGLDSCSAHKFMKFIEENPEHKKLEVFIEPCESSLFSQYIDVYGNYHHCSFCEHKEGLESIDLNKEKDFINKVWKGKEVSNFREMLLKNQRACPVYEV